MLEVFKLRFRHLNLVQNSYKFGTLYLWSIQYARKIFIKFGSVLKELYQLQNLEHRLCPSFRLFKESASVHASRQLSYTSLTLIGKLVAAATSLASFMVIKRRLNGCRINAKSIYSENVRIIEASSRIKSDWPISSFIFLSNWNFCQKHFFM